MEPAPFFADIARAVPHARASWGRAPDGAQVRLGHLGHGHKGTVLLFPGRTEFIEKYGPAGAELEARGYATLAVDWRGQGLTQRLEDTPATGHVDRFAAYQYDVAAMIEAAGAEAGRADARNASTANASTAGTDPISAESAHAPGAATDKDPAESAADPSANAGRADAATPTPTANTEAAFPRPWHLLGHSMGGAIGLRALLSGLPVASAVFTGPMWGIVMNPLLRPAAWALTSLSRPLGLGRRIVPGYDSASYIATAAFEDNQLTTDPETFAWMKQQLSARPELSLGGPSMAWVNEAMREVRALSRLPAPAVPCLTWCGARERIVEIPAIRSRMAAWPDGRLVIEPGAEHEIMMERAAIRTRFFDDAAAHFDRFR